MRAEGILAGSSSGTLLAAALRYCREQSEPKRVVSLVCDSGAKYLSKVFNPAFLAQEGFSHPDRHGTVRDVVIHRYSEGTAVVVRPQDNLRAVFARMRSSDVSQLPVVEESGKVVGLVDESDVLAALLTDPDGPSCTFARPVKDVMMTRLETISADAPIADLVAALSQGLRRDRHGRRPVPRHGDPPRPHQLFPDRAVTLDRAVTRDCHARESGHLVNNDRAMMRGRAPNLERPVVTGSSAFADDDRSAGGRLRKMRPE